MSPYIVSINKFNQWIGEVYWFSTPSLNQHELIRPTVLD